MVESTIVIGYDATQNCALKKKLIFIFFFVCSFRLFDIYVSMTNDIYDIVWLVGFGLAIIIILSNWYIVNIALCVWFMIRPGLHLKTCPCQLNANACNSCFNIISTSLDNRHVRQSRTDGWRPTTDDRRLNIATTMTFLLKYAHWKWTLCERWKWREKLIWNSAKIRIPFSQVNQNAMLCPVVEFHQSSSWWDSKMSWLNWWSLICWKLTVTREKTSETRA